MIIKANEQAEKTHDRALVRHPYGAHCGGYRRIGGGNRLRAPNYSLRVGRRNPYRIDLREAMNEHQKDLIACRKWFDGYKTALIALWKEEDGK